VSYDAIIVGGGPAGASAAILLARAGWSVAVVEKAQFPRPKVCGEFVSATNALLLQELGVGGTFAEAAGPEVRRLAVFAGDAAIEAPMPKAAGGWGRALGRDRLDALLLDAAVAAGARVFMPWRAVALERHGDSFRCRIAAKGREQVLRGRIVVAAHGSWERVGLPTEPEAEPHRPSDLLAFKAHFEGSDLALDLMPLLAFPGGYGGMVTCDGGRVSLSCCIRRDTLAAMRRSGSGRAADAVFSHILASCRGVREALGRARPVDAWLAVGPIRPGIRRRFADGVFLVGNAAGEAHPIVAEGISMAMQSAWMLAGRLAAGEPIGRAGPAYSVDWRRAFATRIRAAAVFAQLAMRAEAAAVIQPILERFPAVLTLGASLGGKTRMPTAA
jgi:flavin-dependent dehydrogenase